MPIDFSFLEGAAPQEESAPTQTDTANVTIRVDADSMLLCDGEYIEQQFKAGVMTKTQLPIGQHILEFISEENADVKVEKIVDFPEAGKSYLVIVNELRAALAEVADTCIIPEGVEVLASSKEFRKYYKGESKVILPSTLKILGDYSGKTIFGDENYDDRQRRKDQIEELLDEQEFDDAAKLEKILAKLEKEKVNIRHIDISRCTQLEIIGKSTFKYCYYLSSVILPNSLREIQEQAFYKCQELNEIVIPENVNIIGRCAFEGCHCLYKVYCEEHSSLREISDQTFRFCRSLKDITIPESVTEIGSSAFEECTSLESITIPKSVTKIEKKAFTSCRSLKKVNFQKPRGVTFKEGAFSYCRDLESFNAPTEPIDAFKGCGKLKLK